MNVSTNRPDSPSEPELQCVLEDDRRRSILRFLRTLDEPIAPLSDVVDHLHVEGHKVTRTALLVWCHHAGLPRLAAAEVIVYDAEKKVVTFDRERIDVVLSAVDDIRD